MLPRRPTFDLVGAPRACRDTIISTARHSRTRRITSKLSRSGRPSRTDARRPPRGSRRYWSARLDQGDDRVRPPRTRSMSGRSSLNGSGPGMASMSGLPVQESSDGWDDHHGDKNVDGPGATFTRHVERRPVAADPYGHHEEDRQDDEGLDDATRCSLWDTNLDKPEKRDEAAYHRIEPSPPRRSPARTVPAALVCRVSVHTSSVRHGDVKRLSKEGRKPSIARKIAIRD
jgi:hypothetical protein